MKMILTKTLYMLMVVCASAFISCGGNEPEPEKKPDPEPEVPSETATIYTKAHGIYLGDHEEPGVGDYSLILYNEDLIFDEDGWYFEGAGEFVWVQLSGEMVKDLKNARLPAGEYKAVDFETVEPLTFRMGFEDMGSFIGQVVDGEETLDLINGGVLTIVDNGTSYAIKMTLTTESGKDRTLKFAGDVAMILFGVSSPADGFDGTFITADAVYHGDYYGVGSGNVEFMLTDMDIDEYGDPIYPGHELYIDLNTQIFASQKDVTLVSGVYTLAPEGNYSQKTFNGGVYEGESLYGTAWVEYDSNGGPEMLYAVTGGTITITKNQNSYAVLAEVMLENGEKRVGEFNGNIKVRDGSCLSQISGNVTPASTKGQMNYRGPAEYYQDDSYNWVIWLATAGIDLGTLSGKGEMMQLEINTSKDSKTEIPSGTYNVMEQIGNDFLLPFTFVPGYIDNLRGVNGTWYTKDLAALAPGVSGTVKLVNKGNGAYIVEYDLVDDYYYTPQPNSIKGKYEGPLTYVDMTASSSAILRKSLSADSSPKQSKKVMNKKNKTSSSKKRAIYR